MSHGQARPHHEFNDKVTVAHAVHTVLGDRVEPKLSSEIRTIDPKGVTCKRTRAKRQDGYPRDKLLKTLEIRTERKRVREEEVGPANGLSALQVTH